MSTFETIKNRRSIRKFEARPLTQENIENLALEAYADGLGSCIIGLVGQTFDEHTEFYEKLGVSSSYKFYISIAVGYPAMTKPKHELNFDKISFID